MDLSQAGSSWFLLAAASAVFFGLQHVLTKKALTGLGDWTTGGIWMVVSAVFLGPFAIGHIPASIPPLFWLVVVGRAVLEIVALRMYLGALRMTDVSFSVPLTAFSPAFVLFLSIGLNGEIPSAFGLAGVALIVGGAAFLEAPPRKTDRPAMRIHALVRHPAFRLMIGATLLWAVCTSSHKIAIGMTNPWFYTGVGSIVLALLMAPCAIAFEGKALRAVIVSRRILPAMLVGIVNTIAFTAMIFAQSETLNATVIAITQVSPLFAALFAFFFLKEPIKRRIIPTILMVAGTILLIFS